MATKANWPEKMIGTRIVDDDGRRVYIICGQGTHDVSVWSEDTETIEARARQIRALPKMVELLKRIGDVGDIRLPEIEREAITILREIGEIE